MESKKKLKRLAKQPEEGRDKYYKKLRREQFKRRQQRKKGLEPQRQSEPSLLARAPLKTAEKKKGKCAEELRFLPRGKIMVSAALKNAMASRNVKKSRTEHSVQSKKAQQSQKPQKAKSSHTTNDFKEIALSNLKRDVGRGSIGSGTFGACYLAKYRGIRVVFKEFKAREHTDMEKLRKEAAYEARVIQSLGDHPGIPLLFGVILEQPTVGIVLQFHGDDEGSMTVYKAAKEEIFKEIEVWNQVLCEVADALEHVHRCGYIHNDLKSNNVVLETREGRPSPVLIDFGKSVLATRAKTPAAKLAHIREQYKNSYIAPELVDGKGKPSVTTDVYSLAFLIKCVYKFLKLEVNATVRDAIENAAESRPSIGALKESLSPA